MYLICKRTKRHQIAIVSVSNAFEVRRIIRKICLNSFHAENFGIYRLQCSVFGVRCAMLFKWQIHTMNVIIVENIGCCWRDDEIYSRDYFCFHVQRKRKSRDNKCCDYIIIFQSLLSSTIHITPSLFIRWWHEHKALKCRWR